MIAKVKSNALTKAGNPANSALYTGYIDNYLAKVSGLDDTIKAQYGSSYSFLFEYVYPRVYELRDDSLVSTSSQTARTEISTATATATATATELLVTGAYREVLLRDTDAVGMDYWEKLIDTGTLNQSLLAQSIACTAKDAA